MWFRKPYKEGIEERIWELEQDVCELENRIENLEGVVRENSNLIEGGIRFNRSLLEHFALNVNSKDGVGFVFTKTKTTKKGK